MNGKSATKKHPRAATKRPVPCCVWSLRTAVTSKPQPVALSTATGTNEVAGCALSLAVNAKKAAIRMTTPSVNQSKPRCEDEERDTGFVVETVLALSNAASSI